MPNRVEKEKNPTEFEIKSLLNAFSSTPIPISSLAYNKPSEHSLATTPSFGPFKFGMLAFLCFSGQTNSVETLRTQTGPCGSTNDLFQA